MRIIAGAWRGRRLVAPKGGGTRPTADRTRQALFDAVWHAPWGGRAAIEDVDVLDAFAGTGALGLEALSRGARHGWFFEPDRTALAAVRANVAACCADARASVLAADATRPPSAPLGGGRPGRGRSRGNRPSGDRPSGDRPSGDRPGGDGPGRCALVFLDPPYRQGLADRALTALMAAGWLAPGALVVAEQAEDEAPICSDPLLDRVHGAARLLVFRA